MSLAELQCMSDFTFLEGASCAEELFAQARAYGIEALAITDRNTLAGIVRAHLAARETGVRLIVGCRLDLACGASLLVYPKHRAGYARLCRLLSLGKSRGGKGKCRLEWSDVATFAEGLVAVLVPAEVDGLLSSRLRHVKGIFGNEAHLALSRTRRQDDRLRLTQLEAAAKREGVKTIVTGNVMFHAPERRILQSVMTCIRLRCTIDELGFRRERTADRQLLPPAEIERLFADHPGAVRRARELASRLRFSLDELRYQYPKEVVEPGLSPQESLTRLTWEAAAEKFPDGIPLTVQKTIAHELRLIAQLDYAPYFLTVHSIVRYARSQDILCQGRGSAANSVVCYVLGITSISPESNNLLFERFVSAERNEPPDIDVDFEHERRETVIQWIYETYGRHRAALCSTVVRYRGRGALRDVGKALGLPEDLIHGLSRQVSAWSAEGVTEELAKELNLQVGHRLHMAIALARQLMGFPRHLSQHVGGFVLTHDRLDELVPIEPARMEDRQVIEWDKDDIEILKFMKVDVLALGMLSCLKRGLDLLKEHKGLDYEIATIPQEDPATYDMICEGDTLGVFQIESRAQMNMLPRLKPRTLYDLVVEVAIVRPGPIQGDMVHPYLKRRQGIEKVDLPTAELRQVLGKTLGIPLFQEQAMQVAIVCAGFTPGEADKLRRSMATFKYTGGVSQYHDRLIDGMAAKGYDRDFALRIFKQLEGFGSYGFPESHAASFALLAYVSSWLKCHHPDVFCCALLNAQPMGFYAPAQIVRDASEHGVEIHPICINASQWDSTLEPTTDPGRFAVRLGMRLAKSVSEVHAKRIVETRHTPYASVEQVWRRAGVPAAPLRHLAAADAFLPSLGIARRDALWAVKALRDDALPLLAHRGGHPELLEPITLLQPMTAGREVVEDYHRVGLTLRMHPVGFLRQTLSARGLRTCAEIAAAKDGQKIRAAGLVLVRQKPGSAKGTMFITIEDETGIANLVVWPRMYERFRRLILTVGMIGVVGRIQRTGTVVHLVVEELTDLSAELASIAGLSGEFPVPFARADVVTGGGGHDTTAFSSRHLDVPKPLANEDIDPIRVKTRDFR